MVIGRADDAIDVGYRTSAKYDKWPSLRPTDTLRPGPQAAGPAKSAWLIAETCGPETPEIGFRARFGARLRLITEGGVIWLQHERGPVCAGVPDR